MKNRGLFAALLGVSLFVGGAQAEESRLMALARLVPADITSPVTLIDMNAIRAELAGIEPIQSAPYVASAPYAVVPVRILAFRSYAEFPDDFERDMGFALPSLDGIAFWEHVPKAQAILVNDEGFDSDAISAALTARGYQAEALGERNILRLGKDGAIGRSNGDAFSDLSHSARVAIDGPVLRYARKLADFEAMLEPAETLDDALNLKTILDAANKAPFPGRVTQVHRIMAPALTQDIVLIAWQDGTTISAAWAIGPAEGHGDPAALRSKFTELGRHVLGEDVEKHGEWAVTSVEIESGTIFFFGSTRELEIKTQADFYRLSSGPFGLLVQAMGR